MASFHPLPLTTHRLGGGSAVGLALMFVVVLPSAAPAQEAKGTEPVAQLRVERFSPGSHLTRLEGPARPGAYVGAVGTRAAWLGTETGSGEVWIHPLKVAREIRLSFKIPDYPEPILGDQVARKVEVAPGNVTITYSHGAFVVKEHILAPRERPGILILLDADAVVQLEIHVEFQPVLQYAWPGGFGGQYLYWDAENRAFVLSESLQDRNAVIGSPWATEASAHPAHRLAEAPSVFVIPVDRERAREEMIPIAVTGGIAPRDAVLASYRRLIAEAPLVAREIERWAESLSSEALAVAASSHLAPDRAAMAETALEWAEVNLAEQRVCNPDLGCGFVAGWGPSGTSLRPGFGWFFGGDAAINSLAMDATGQWSDVAEALRFLARYQRDDGKIPHEISQAAARVPWFDEFPYAYYHADTTPYWMLAVWYYWRASGDDALLADLWPAYRKAYEWCLSVETDGDGIIENTTGGLGAIEVGGLGEGLHQDIYLAAVWISALQGTAEMAGARGETALASEARDLFAKARASLNREYWMPEAGYHAFGILQDGGTNDNLTAWPGTALSFGLLDPEEAEGTLSHLAGDAISSSWGARLLSTGSRLYDPLHYNNGAVWPFMTGFVALGQYRYRRPWAGYPLLQALWALNEDWSLGRHPENLSGAFYQTLDATVPHQFFASSMLVTPFARGLLGWEPDAPARRATLAPQPPPDWSRMAVRNLAVGGSRIAMTYERSSSLTSGASRGSSSSEVEVELRLTGPDVVLTYTQPIPPGARNVRTEAPATSGREPPPVRLSGTQPTDPVEGRHDLQLPVTVHLSEGDTVRLRFAWEGGLEVFPDFGPRLRPGERSGGIRILDFTRGAGGEDWSLTLEGDGGGTGSVLLRGEEIVPGEGVLSPIAGTDDMYRLTVSFDGGSSRVVRTVHLRPASRLGS